MSLRTSSFLSYWASVSSFSCFIPDRYAFSFVFPEFVCLILKVGMCLDIHLHKNMFLPLLCRLYIDNS